MTSCCFSGGNMEVELYYKGELRRFPLQARLSFNTLVSLVHSKFPELLTKQFTLSCRVDDSDGATVNICSDENLENAVRVNRATLLHIIVDDTVDS